MVNISDLGSICYSIKTFFQTKKLTYQTFVCHKTPQVPGLTT